METSACEYECDTILWYGHFSQFGCYGDEYHCVGCFRLRELEDQKASWETEREELVRAQRDKEKETTETLSR